MALLLESVVEIINSGNGMIQETLGNSMDSLCSTLLFYVRESETQTLLQAFVNNLGLSEASSRRASAKGIASICKYYPKSLFPFTISLLLPDDMEEIKNFEPFKLQGVLRTLVQLIELSNEMKHDKYDSQDPMKEHLPTTVPFLEYW